MRAAVVYDEADTNTAALAAAIGRGLRAAGIDVDVEPFERYGPSKIVDLDLLVVGAPTHDHGLSRHVSYEETPEGEQDRFEGTTPEPRLRDWLEDLPDGAGRASVAFDTREHGPKLLTGSAGRTIESKLEEAGFQIAAPAESFLVTKEDSLEEGEETRAESWASDMGGLLETVLEE